MAELICPNCKQETFSWTYDDEFTPPTHWGCRNCGYGADEDESLERMCVDCGKKTESQLVDSEKKYWWCSTCNKVTIIEDNIQ